MPVFAPSLTYWHFSLLSADFEEWDYLSEQERDQHRKTYRTYRGLLQKCIDGSAQDSLRDAASSAGSSERMNTPETIAIVISVVALLTSIAGVATPPPA
ncbi:hypothetical protein [Corynebacterium hadale]|uniref:hypothetical protein n=1 Tax=Corynebacterium hadale TaxID=2026255 RepID=UPI0010560F39|nr:hypothetical protein [Corynebacterium hadale]